MTELRVGFSIRPGVAPQRGVDGRWHVLYITSNPNTGSWYGGKHSTSRLDDGYRGSGHWVTRHKTPDVLTTEIFAFYDNEDELVAAEAAWMTFEIIDCDQRCRNLTEGGHGLTPTSSARLLARPEVIAKFIGRTHTQETIDKISAAHIGKQKSPEAVAKSVEKRRGRKHSPEARKKMSDAGLGRNKSAETRRRMSAASRGRKHSPEARKKMSDAAKLRSPETIDRMRTAFSGRKHSPEAREKMSDAGRGRVRPAAIREKIAAGLRGRKHSPETRRKLVAAWARRRTNAA